jgi:serine/threonine protein kinase
MSNCLCLACDRANSITTRFCTQCGAKLQIQERYRALKVIGQGGFGKTFLAQDESKPSKPRCVIKQFAFETINPNASQGTLDIAIRLFEQEAKRLNDLGKHSQIPELLSFTVHEGKQYLIQEFIDGETLEQELRRVGAFSVQQVRDALVEVLQILEFVHSKSVIHRDISPDNIIRRRSDQKLVLVDFGAAKHATATLLAKTGTSIGKASYGAPEQMLGKSVFQSDLFGLGVTCLHLLTNVEPFTLYDVLENEYQWRQFLNGKVVSDEFGKLLDRMTAYRVKERPNSVTESLQELGVGRKTSTSVNTSSGVYSFKAEELKAEHRVSIPSSIPNKQAPSSNKNSSQNSSSSKSNSLINQHIRQAESYITQKLWASALQELRSAIQIDENNSTCQALLGVVYMNQNLIGSAKICFQQALKINPSEPLAIKYITKVGGIPPNSVTTQQVSASSNTYVNQNASKSSVELLSEKNIDYKELESLLKKKDWKAADEITTEIILKITGREKEGWITNVNMNNFPRTDLLTIDRLWLYYSERKFGFSCQVKIWFDCGGEIEEYDKEAYKRFLTKIGWYDPIKFAKKINHYKFMDKTNNGQNAPDAGLPNLFYEVGISSNAIWILSSLAQKFLKEASSPKQTSTFPKKTQLNTSKSNTKKVASKPVVSQKSESITNNKGCMMVIMIALLLLTVATVNPAPIVVGMWLMQLGIYAGQKEKK